MSWQYFSSFTGDCLSVSIMLIPSLFTCTLIVYLSVFLSVCLDLAVVSFVHSCWLLVLKAAVKLHWVRCWQCSSVFTTLWSVSALCGQLCSFCHWLWTGLCDTPCHEQNAPLFLELASDHLVIYPSNAERNIEYWQCLMKIFHFDV